MSLLEETWTKQLKILNNQINLYNNAIRIYSILLHKSIKDKKEWLDNKEKITLKKSNTELSHEDITKYITAKKILHLFNINLDTETNSINLDYNKFNNKFNYDVTDDNEDKDSNNEDKDEILTISDIEYENNKDTINNINNEINNNLNKNLDNVLDDNNEDEIDVLFGMDSIKLRKLMDEKRNKYYKELNNNTDNKNNNIDNNNDYNTNNTNNTNNIDNKTDNIDNKNNNIETRENNLYENDNAKLDNEAKAKLDNVKLDNEAKAKLDNEAKAKLDITKHINYLHSISNHERNLLMQKIYLESVAAVQTEYNLLSEEEKNKKINELADKKLYDYVYKKTAL